MALRRGLLRLTSSSTSVPLRSTFRASPSISIQCQQAQGYSSGEQPQRKAAPVKVPTQVYGIGGKYAESLYKVAVPANKLEEVYKELNEILKSVEKSPTFGEFLTDTSVPNHVKVKAVRTLFKELKFSDITINFLAVLAENGRLQVFHEVMKSLADLVMAHKKQVKATVTTVLELKSKEMERLKKALRRFVKPDQTIVLSQKIDNCIMGGLVVEVGDKYIDLSIATKLKDMERVLRQPLPDFFA